MGEFCFRIISARLSSAHPFYVDNTGAIHRIFNGSPGKAQSCSRRFRAAVLDIIDRKPSIDVVIDWAPGHEGIIGNELADKRAKSGAKLVPRHPEYLSASYVGSVQRRALSDFWLMEWASAKHARNAFTAANRIRPSLKPTKHFLLLSRKELSHTVQC